MSTTPARAAAAAHLEGARRYRRNNGDRGLVVMQHAEVRAARAAARHLFRGEGQLALTEALAWNLLAERVYRIARERATVGRPWRP